MMAEATVNSLSVRLGKDPEKDPNMSDTNATLFHRRIEFHLARKPFTGFIDGGNSGFKLVTLNPNSNLGSKSEPHKAWSGMASSEPSSFENHSGLDPELSLTITFRRIGAGLQNLGNTCFLNSVLQCLTYTEPLAAYLQSGRHKISCRTAGFCALCAIQKHVSRALESTGRILAPNDLVSNLRCISRNFRNARQEDAHEYMVNLLESMHKCCLPSGVPSESPSAYEKSLVHKIFGGRLRSQVKCMQCSFCSNKFDPFLDLSLEIVKADSLHKALAHFTAKEQLDGGERQYQCQQCKQKVKALKQLTVYKAPQVLAIHLKRFSAHMSGQKIDKKIEFGPTLDLKPFVTGPYDGDLKYTLYGVLVHAGWSTHSGHYYCFVRTSSGMWYSLDDNQVIQVSERRVLEQKAYMLFYVRDRVYSTPKKAVDVVHKESMVINTLGRKAFSNFNQASRENVSNGTVDKNLNDSFSAATAQKDAPNPNISNQIQMKLDSIHEVNGPERSSLKEDHPTENSLKVPLIVDSVNGLPVSSSNGGESSVQSLSSFKGSNDFVNLRNSINVSSSSCTGLATLVIKQDDSKGIQSCSGKNENDSVAIQTTENISASARKNLDNAVDKPQNSNALQRSPEDTSIPTETNASKVGDISEYNGLVDSSVQKANDIKDGACLPPIPKGSRHKKAVDVELHLVKRRPLKCPVTTKHLSTNIILRAAMGRRKKKRRGRHSSRKLELNHVLSDLGSSTSKKYKTLSMSSSTYSPRRVECNSEERDKVLGVKSLSGNGNLLKGVNDVFMDKIGQNGEVLSTDRVLHRSSCSTLDERLSDTGKLCGSKNNRVENGLISMHTRGLEETTVARWDGVEHPSELLESRSAESFSIGYVGDEWDQEYDCGKRKKIRSSKLRFDGSNPFQEIAMEKAKTKKAKLDRSSSANQPFRIL
ncbi:hypothetical protein ACH5RR_006605 [Cinchona calisaya]|uniref:Ubiquitin carboxyl-terminal hydrolase n=1 Tax=Cinchona calisaya TaxID=153742 RepID=A0ABD3APF4_9GENT